MTDNTLGARGDDDNAASKDPSDWVTGGEPATAAQLSYLDTLAREAGEELSADLTKAEASEEIERRETGPGRGSTDTSLRPTANSPRTCERRCSPSSDSSHEWGSAVLSASA